MIPKVEFFSGDPPCQDCLKAFTLADEYAAERQGRVEVIKLFGAEAMEKFRAYNLSCTPAIVIEGRLKIEGICPSRETLDRAVREVQR
ncbi:MAG: thioredoxin family protein [Clostridia bacterium]|nr:thioredoxin family protein [Clostridia bacterium]MDH7573116.1 thioredoxin family protein [Clostridia bacterium]